MIDVGVLYSYGPHQGIIDGFKEIGCKVRPFYYGLNTSNSLLNRVLIAIMGVQLLLDIRFNYKFFLAIVGNNIQLLVVFKPKKLFWFNRRILRRKINLILITWTTDSIERFPDQLSLSNYSDKVYIQDGTDKERDSAFIWLPLGYDGKLFNFSHRFRDIDVLLIGNCNYRHYSKRVSYYEEISSLAKNGLRIVFIGGGLPVDTRNKLIDNGVEVRGKMSLSGLSIFMKRAKICVNVHQDDGGHVINPMFFAIPACGTIELCDERAYLHNWLVKDKSYYTSSLEEVNKKIEILILVFDDVEKRLSAATDASRYSYEQMGKTILSGFL